MGSLLTLRSTLTTLMAASLLSVLATTASANHDARYMAKHHRKERKAVAEAYEVRRDAVRYAHREAIKAINDARKHASRLCDLERRAALRSLDRRRSAELNLFRYTMTELDAEYRVDRARLDDEFRASLNALRRTPPPVVVENIAVPVHERIPIRPAHVHVERRIRAQEYIPHGPIQSPVDSRAPMERHAPATHAVDVPRLIGGILDLYLSLR